MAPKRTVRRKDEDGKRAELVSAAARVIADEGVAASTTRRIAAEAGVPHGVVHYWFGGKDELLTAVVEAVLNDINAATTASQTLADGTSIPSLGDAFRAAWQTVVDDVPGRQLSVYELTTTALRTEGMEELASQQYAAYCVVASAAIEPWYAESGLDLPGGIDALSRLIAYLFDGTTLAWLADHDAAQPVEVFDLLIHLLESAKERAVPEARNERDD